MTGLYKRLLSKPTVLLLRFPTRQTTVDQTENVNEFRVQRTKTKQTHKLQVLYSDA